MTCTIRSLETKALVERMTASRDARVNLVRLTQAGEGVVNTLRKAVAETISDLLAPKSKDEK